MRIFHVSDLHLDNAMSGGPFGWLGRFDVSAYAGGSDDTLVVAGDTAEQVDDAIDALNAAARRFRSVVATWGNHEKGLPTHARAPNLHVLDLQAQGLHIDPVTRVGYVGGCLTPGDDGQFTRTEEGLRSLEAAAAVDRIVIVSHFVPTPRIGPLVGLDLREKCNNLLERVPPKATKPTAVVFGHAHIEIDATLDGVRLVSNPRGYRRQRRDQTLFRDFKELAVVA